MNGNDNLSTRAYLAIGMMLFALFFGAGNLIFPAALGQQAGDNVGWALLGFVLTGVGLPLLGVAAMGYSSCKAVSYTHLGLASILIKPLVIPLW